MYSLKLLVKCPIDGLFVHWCKGRPFSLFACSWRFKFNFKVQSLVFFIDRCLGLLYSYSLYCRYIRPKAHYDCWPSLAQLNGVHGICGVTAASPYIARQSHRFTQGLWPHTMQPRLVKAYIQYFPSPFGMLLSWPEHMWLLVNSLPMKTTWYEIVTWTRHVDGSQLR